MCKLLNRFNWKTHTLKNCYANPQSDKAQPNIVKIRYAEIKRKGIPLPPCMEDYDKKMTENAGGG